MTNSFGSLRIYMGFNFWKKKEYRDKKNKKGAASINKSNSHIKIKQTQ